LDLEHLTLEQIKVILPSQVSPSFLATLSKRLEVPSEHIVNVHAEHDLSTSSLAYTLHAVREQGRVQAGDVGLIINVGSGMQVGCATYYF
ncbi:MAG TPA: 3-oxoacyl-[acyl-carrier-protein] synthase III C-terminal domain-containing protein, partial [Ktedonobacteraceae bacterium]|nr:3-oxoacyl-[acyl-carrier-protein] synthase III C-terminal domain-containing protein [Ktedonobacteraceae bacterium]